MRLQAKADTKRSAAPPARKFRNFSWRGSAGYGVRTTLNYNVAWFPESTTPDHRS